MKNIINLSKWSIFYFVCLIVADFEMHLINLYQRQGVVTSLIPTTYRDSMTQKISLVFFLTERINLYNFDRSSYNVLFQDALKFMLFLVTNDRFCSLDKLVRDDG